MMSPRLAQIARKLDRAKPPPAEKAEPASGDLGAAIEQLIAEQVEARVGLELDRQQDLQHNPRLRHLLRSSQPTMATDFKDVPPPPRTPLPTVQGATIQRGEDGRATVVNIGSMQYRVVRDHLGRASALMPADAAEGESR
ncbi:hypothetical protein F3I62_03575 [Pseudomonas sp. R-28-1W-6]|uniref:hypothetical protein n=1 Tax=Pseudomonas sp. R-28-1W-6 TaxID=2650101 RepID=UPI00136575D4|nr:hypothetical protein [Pseudomonas sp. R-28-1W-6]MWV11168.1 hypothetical protein [Pseudomonas sp. R-28-1W-6]